jgi:hypothetical protein
MDTASFVAGCFDGYLEAAFLVAMMFDAVVSCCNKG